MNLRCIVVAAALMSIQSCKQKQVVPEWIPPPIELNADTTLVCDDPAAPGCAAETPFDELVRRSIGSPAEAKPHYVRLLNKGDETLLLIIHLIRSARESIYIEQFIWSADETGLYIFQELVKAARRGVEVKILNDWFMNFGDTKLVAATALAHENLQEKVYNPFYRQLEISSMQTAMAGLSDISGINQRMHNKLLVVDGKVAILGGRNYEDKYFDRDPEYNFKDRDIFVVGPEVEKMVESFHEYWNYEYSIYIHYLDDVWDHIAAKVDLPDVMEVDVGASFADIDRIASDYGDIRELFVTTAYRVDGQVEFLADPPGKLEEDDEEEEKAEAEVEKEEASPRSHSALTPIVMNADSSLVVQTPYLILTKPIRRQMRDLRKERPDMEIIASTNSLAANDHFFTYAITMKQKKYLLQKVGMQIFEFKPVPGDVREMITRYDELVVESNGQNSEDVDDGRLPITAEGPITGLHAKAIVIDDRIAYVGSHNFDPRSIGHDTQLGILIWDADVALALKADILRDTEAQNSWVTAAKHEGIPLVSFFGGMLEDISRAMPIFDVWPFKYSTSWELREGEEPVPPGHPEFYQRYNDVGQFPTVNMTTKDIQTRLFRVMGGFTEPLM